MFIAKKACNAVSQSSKYEEITLPHEFFCVYFLFHWGNFIKKNVVKSKGVQRKDGGDCL